MLSRLFRYDFRFPRYRRVKKRIIFPILTLLRSSFKSLIYTSFHRLILETDAIPGEAFQLVQKRCRSRVHSRTPDSFTILTSRDIESKSNFLNILFQTFSSQFQFDSTPNEQIYIYIFQRIIIIIHCTLTHPPLLLFSFQDLEHDAMTRGRERARDVRPDGMRLCPPS